MKSTPTQARMIRSATVATSRPVSGVTIVGKLPDVVLDEVGDHLSTSVVSSTCAGITPGLPFAAASSWAML